MAQEGAFWLYTPLTDEFLGTQAHPGQSTVQDRLIFFRGISYFFVICISYNSYRPHYFIDKMTGTSYFVDLSLSWTVTFNPLSRIGSLDSYAKEA